MNWNKPRTASDTMDAADYVAQTAKAQRKASKGTARRLEAQGQELLIARINALVATDPRRFVDLYYTHHSANESAGGPMITLKSGVSVPASVLRNAKMGTRAGYPDLVNHTRRAYGGATWAGIGLELKIAPNTLEPEQDNWLQHLHRQGWYVECLTAADARSLADAAWLLLCGYLGIAERDYAPLLLS